MNKIIAPIRAVSTVYCVYSITQKTEVIFVGCCKFSELSKFSDANTNNLFVEMVDHSDHLLVDILHCNADPDQAYQVQLEAIQKHKPICNLRGKHVDKNSRIECITTGAIYDSAAQVCEAFGITRGALSNHLNRRKGYATINKLHFKRI